MKPLVLLAILAGAAFTASAQVAVTDTSTRIYIVRHAEKEQGKDPVLTPAGLRRAGDLARVMQDKRIQRIYVTQYLRTQMTADSVRILLGVDTVHYLADTTGEDLIRQIGLHNDWGKPILVVGHSNTILRIARRFGVKLEGSADVPDYEFDNLLYLRFKNGKPIFVNWKYGVFSKYIPEGKPTPMEQSGGH